MLTKNPTVIVPKTPPNMSPQTVVGDGGPSIRQKIFDHIAPGLLPGPITGNITNLVKSTDEVRPMVMTEPEQKKRQYSDLTSHFFELDDVTPESMRTKGSKKTEVSSAESVKLKPAPPIKFADIQPGDLVFTVAGPDSRDRYEFVAWGQSFQEEIYTKHQEKLPVDISRVIHCDIAVGDGAIAHPIGPQDDGELLAMGRATPTRIDPIANYEDDENQAEEYVVLRPTNKDVAEKLAEKAKNSVTKEHTTYDLDGVFTNGAASIIDNYVMPNALVKKTVAKGIHIATGGVKLASDALKLSADAAMGTYNYFRSENAPWSPVEYILSEVQKGAAYAAQGGKNVAKVGAEINEAAQKLDPETTSMAFRQEVPRLLGKDVQGPQEGPIDIPDAMYCSSFDGNMLMHAERETVRDDRGALTESLTMAAHSPAMLFAELGGSGNFEIFKVDKSDDSQKVTRADLLEAADFPYN